MSKNGILFVDDEEEIHEIYDIYFQAEIEANNIEAHHALSCREALKILDADTDKNIVCVISDINMPNENGFILLEKIKERFPHLISYLVTAYDSPEYRERAKLLNAKDFITKPIVVKEMKAKLLEDLEPVGIKILV